MEKLDGIWSNLGKMPTQTYTCAHCEWPIASEEGLPFIDRYNESDPDRNIYICHRCNRPTIFMDDVQIPSPSFGENVDHLPDDVSWVYDEARECMTVSYTAAVMLCRKLLMHVAVEKKAKAGEAFAYYVDYLSDKYIAPDNKAWVDKIRDKGNEANHEITQKTQREAEDMISFSWMLLKIIYEFSGMIKPPDKAEGE